MPTPSSASVPQSDLSYVGARPYIRGADLYAWFEEQIASSLPDDQRTTSVRQFRLVREIRRNGAWVEGESPGASATLNLGGGALSGSRYSFAETGDVIVRRTPDIASSVLEFEQTGVFAGSATLAATDTVGFLNGLIEANKKLHTNTLSARGVTAENIRLIFIENMPLQIAPAGKAALRFHHLSERKVGPRRYTSNAVSIDGGPPDLRICYSF